VSGKKKTFENFFNDSVSIFAEATRLLKTKNEDYTNRQEPFENFEKVSKVCKILGIDITKRHHGALYQIISKITRLLALDGREANHESIRDTCVDGINYFVLYYGMVDEDKDED